MVVVSVVWCKFIALLTVAGLGIISVIRVRFSALPQRGNLLSTSAMPSFRCSLLLLRATARWKQIFLETDAATSFNGAQLSFIGSLLFVIERLIVLVSRASGFMYEHISFRRRRLVEEERSELNFAEGDFDANRNVNLDILIPQKPRLLPILSDSCSLFRY